MRDAEELTEAERGQPIFQSHLCQVWELAAQAAEHYGVRVCRLRFGLVLGSGGGGIEKMGTIPPAGPCVSIAFATIYVADLDAAAPTGKIGITGNALPPGGLHRLLPNRSDASKTYPNGCMRGQGPAREQADKGVSG